MFGSARILAMLFCCSQSRKPKKALPPFTMPNSTVWPPVSTTDYVGNAAADGSGADRTANITITATFFATVAKLVIDNSHASDVYMTTLQIRGKGIYDLDPVAYESSSTQTFGRRQLDIDMLYAEDGNVAQDLANYLRSQFDALDRYVTEVELKPHTSAAILQSVIDSVERSRRKTSRVSISV